MTTAITQEMVKERLELLRKEFQRLLDLIKVYEGAIQDCDYWISRLEEDKNGIA